MNDAVSPRLGPSKVARFHYFTYKNASDRCAINFFTLILTCSFHIFLLPFFLILQNISNKLLHSCQRKTMPTRLYKQRILCKHLTVHVRWAAAICALAHYLFQGKCNSVQTALFRFIPISTRSSIQSFRNDKFQKKHLNCTKMVFSKIYPSRQISQ